MIMDFVKLCHTLLIEAPEAVKELIPRSVVYQYLMRMASNTLDKFCQLLEFIYPRNTRK